MRLRCVQIATPPLNGNTECLDRVCVCTQRSREFRRRHHHSLQDGGVLTAPLDLLHVGKIDGVVKRARRVTAVAALTGKQCRASQCCMHNQTERAGSPDVRFIDDA